MTVQHMIDAYRRSVGDDEDVVEVVGQKSLDERLRDRLENAKRKGRRRRSQWRGTRSKK